MGKVTQQTHCRVDIRFLDFHTSEEFGKVRIVVANADPPDPTWISGCWDDGDEDDVINDILAIPGWAATLDPVFVTVLVTYPFVPESTCPEITPAVVAPIASRAPPLPRPRRR